MVRGDIDNDGDIDLVLCQPNRHVMSLRNEAGKQVLDSLSASKERQKC